MARILLVLLALIGLMTSAATTTTVAPASDRDDDTTTPSLRGTAGVVEGVPTEEAAEAIVNNATETTTVGATPAKGSSSSINATETTTAPAEQEEGDKAATGLYDIERWLMYYTNQLRASRGKAPLCFNSKLQQAARISASKQAFCKQMAHTTCDGVTMMGRIQQVGFQYSAIAENVAWRSSYTSAEACAKALVGQWKNSPPHYKNIMGGYTMGGMTVYKGQNGYYYATQVFGSSGSEKCW